MSDGSWRDVASARRILCYGVTGSGKSTLAVRLGAALGIPVSLVDDIGWLPGWTARDPAETAERVTEILARPAWVADSIWSRQLPLALDRAEVIVALDYPRAVSLARLVRRTVRRIRTAERVCNGNVETLRRTLSADSIIRWHFSSWRRKRERIRAWAADPAAPTVVRLRRPSDADDLLARLRATVPD